MTMKPAEQKHKLSKTAYENACRVIPGGVNSPVRAFREVGGTPLFIRSARGSRIYDIDGSEYIDYVGSWGPMILGHAHPAVVKAVQDAAVNGTSYGAPTEAETQLAARIIHAFPSIQKVRMLSSGTEAVMTAVRLARAFTARDLIVKMIGCYHGHSDSMLVKAGSGVAELAAASSAGVPADLAAKTIAIPYNDSDALKLAFTKLSRPDRRRPRRTRRRQYGRHPPAARLSRNNPTPLRRK
jgi:glutamate-1-semialdehyde 2,1-aminomutase